MTHGPHVKHLGCAIERDGTDVFLIVDGVRLARREAGEWIPLGSLYGGSLALSDTESAAKH
jgi:hypothetical protein